MFVLGGGPSVFVLGEEEGGGERTHCFRHSGQVHKQSSWLGQPGPGAEADSDLIMNKDRSSPRQEDKQRPCMHMPGKDLDVQRACASRPGRPRTDVQW